MIIIKILTLIMQYSWTHVIRILKGIQNLFELHEFSNYRSSDYFDQILKKNKQGMFLHDLEYCTGWERAIYTNSFYLKHLYLSQ